MHCSIFSTSPASTQMVPVAYPQPQQSKCLQILSNVQVCGRRNYPQWRTTDLQDKGPGRPILLLPSSPTLPLHIHLHNINTPKRCTPKKAPPSCLPVTHSSLSSLFIVNTLHCCTHHTILFCYMHLSLSRL